MSHKAHRPLNNVFEVTPSTRPSTRVQPITFERFAEYLLIGKLGQGGMAEVFLALSEGPNDFRKLHVLKRLHGHLHDDPRTVDAFHREAKLAARLHHPNVVQTNAVGCYRGQHFLAMEYLDGQPLNRVLQRLRDEEIELPPALAARIACDALEGLHYAHEARDYDGTKLAIVHRDVSPHNLFVTYEGQVKLLDFGIAKAAATDGNTRTGLIKGKLAYIAPEQARGEEVDRRADLWAIGVTLFEMLSGRRLFRGQTEAEILRASLVDDRPLLVDAAPSVPDSLARVVERALARDPDKRFSTALEMKDALELWLLEDAASGSGSRATLAALVKALFFDKIEERRAVLRTCMNRALEAEQPGVEPAPARALSSYPVPTAGSSPARGRALKLATLLLAMGLAVLLGLWGGGDVGSRANAFAERAPANVQRTALPIPQAKATEPAKPAAAVSAPVASAPIAPAPALLDAAPSASPSAPTLLPADSDARARERARRSALALSEKLRAEAVQALATEAVELPEPAREPLREERPHTPEPPRAQPAARGKLSLDSTPYAIVTLDGQRLGITPLDLELEGSTYTLSLRNPEQGIETTYRVTIPPGEHIRRVVALE